MYTMHDDLSALRGLDLDQLVYLDVLLRRCSVSRAAEEVGLTQSAMSHALRRLRGRFDDPLLVRVGAGMALTPFSERLRPRLRAALVTLEHALVRSTPFDPATASRVFRLASPDLFDLLVLPALMHRLQEAGPGLALQVSSFGRPDLEPALAAGDVDLAVLPLLKGAGTVGHDAYMRRTLFRDGFRCFLRAGHPALEDWGLASWLGLGHLLVAPTGRAGGLVDRVLAEQGARRTVALQVEGFAVAPEIIARTDLVLTAPASLARLTRPMGLVDVAPPVPLPDHGLALLWHRRYGDDPSLRWLMAQVQDAMVGRVPLAPVSAGGRA